MWQTYAHAQTACVHAEISWLHKRWSVSRHKLEEKRRGKMRTVAILSFCMQMSSSRWLLFSCLMGLGSCLSCPGWPCNPAEHCTGIDLSNCRYGVVKDTCHCCDVCGLGPGETCGLEGRCGAGMECVKDAPDYITGADLDQYPGECITATSEWIES